MLDTDAGADGGVDAEKPYRPPVARNALLIPDGDCAPPAPADNGGVPVLVLYIVGAAEKPAVPDIDSGGVLGLKDATAGWDAGDDWSGWVVMPSPLDPPSGT